MPRSQSSFVVVLVCLCGLTGCGGAVDAVVFDSDASTGTPPTPGGDDSGEGPPTTADATVPPNDGGVDGTVAPTGDATVITSPDAGSDTSTPPPDDATTPDDADLDGGSPVPDADDGPDCAPKPHAHVDGGLFCPRSKTDGGAIDCDPSSQVCCLSNNDGGPSTCETGETCAPKESIWECAGPEDCDGKASGGTCCLTAGPLEVDPKCAANEQTTGKHTTTCTQKAECVGTIDAAKTTDTLYVVCDTQGDCPAGKTCTDVRVLGSGLGLCL